MNLQGNYLISIISQWIWCDIHIHAWYNPVQTTILVNRRIDAAIARDVTDGKTVRLGLNVIRMCLIFVSICDKWKKNELTCVEKSSKGNLRLNSKIQND